MTLLTAEEWDRFIGDHPEAHILQTPEWAELKAAFGWSARYLRQDGIGALILFKRLPFGLSVAYIPRGPVGRDSRQAFWLAVDELCRREHAVFLRVEPDVWQPVEDGFIAEHLPGFVQSVQTVQPPRTIQVDLRDTEDVILSRMKAKTRYNIRLAGRKGVVVKPGRDVEAFHRMMLKTGERDEFGVHSLAYYQKAFEIFASRDACVLLTAEYEGRPLAGLMAFAYGNTAWYFYGASTNAERNRMPTYPLQWEAMRWAKSKGCRVYDLWGVPDYPESTLEESFLERSDGLWGVYRFKRGFGGEVRHTIGAWDRIYQPLYYKLYNFLTGGRKTPAA